MHETGTGYTGQSLSVSWRFFLKHVNKNYNQSNVKKPVGFFHFNIVTSFSDASQTHSDVVQTHLSGMLHLNQSHGDG